MDLMLPYKVGDLGESKSFVKGFRSAWFRCKIHSMRVSESGHLECYLEYVDYPGEKKEWIKLYQKNPDQNANEGSQIMIRPSFPRWFLRDQVPEWSPNSNIIAIVDKAWKVGDLVDWSSEGCYWSGKVTKLLNKDTVEVELPAPPIGEGNRYPAKKNDLRPTLDWSLSKGWTVPLSQAKGKKWHAARLIRHYDSADEETSSVDEDGGGGDDDDKGVQQPVSRAASNAPQEAPDSLIPKPPSAANSSASLNTHKDAVLTSMEDYLMSTSTSKPPDPSQGAQAAGTSSQPSTTISIKQEPGTRSFIMQEQDSPLAHEADDVPDKCLEKLKAVEDKLKHLLERSRAGRKRSEAVACRAKDAQK